MTKEQFLDSGWFTYVWIIAVSLWGGMASFFEKHEPFSWMKLIAHLVSAGFAGIITMYVCQSAHIPEAMTGALCGVAAHMGTPALMKIKLIRQFFEKDSKE